jgi:biotin-(acetyl-CoA carboxylase) ligase
LPFAIKWPNDVYYDKKHKISGILVNSSIMGNEIFIKIGNFFYRNLAFFNFGDRIFNFEGVGFNVNNEHPTISLNKILKENNLPTWTIEEFIARFMNQFEKFLPMLIEGSTFLTEVENNWMHE